MPRRLAICTLLACALGAAMPARAQVRVYLEDLTWTELADAMKAGTTTVIVPIGGTEQNGPHMALGKHNARVKVLAGRIAASLGHTVVAPVLAYVPEGRISPPTGHMRFPGTISAPDEPFAALLADAARSFRQEGFRDVVFIGDSGDYQGTLDRLAQRLNREWASGPARAHYIGTYYRTARDGVDALLRSRGLTAQQVGVHAGSADTALLMATAPQMVRADRLADAAAGAPGNGVNGDPRAATAALGEAATDLIVRDSVVAIRTAIDRSR